MEITITMLHVGGSIKGNNKHLAFIRQRQNELVLILR